MAPRAPMKSPTPTASQRTSGYEAEESDGANANGQSPGRTKLKASLRGKTADVQAVMIAPGVLDATSFERWVQSGLNAVDEIDGVGGFLRGPLEVNGRLGRQTRIGVRGFQRVAKKLGGRSLAVDGIVGKNTLGALEKGTATIAPTVKERDRVEAPAPPAPVLVHEGAHGDASGGGGGDGGGAAASTQAPKPEPAKAAEKGEAPKDAEAKAELATGKAADAAPAKAAKAEPVKKRSGDAGKADRLRAKWRDGMLVSLSIPKGFADKDAVIDHVDKDNKSLDSYAYRVHYPKYAAANPTLIQGHWASIRAGRSARKIRKLPATYAVADAKQKKAIRRIVQGTKASYKVIKAAMWANAGWKKKLARTAYANNKHIPSSSEGYARAQRAVAGDGGTVKIGRSMIYHTKNELPEKATATSKAVGALLEANPPENGPIPEADMRTARIRFLTVSAHGWPTGMGGHGDASKAKFKNSQVAGLVSKMSAALAPDVRVRLFACKTSRVKGGQDSEGSMGDAWRDALIVAKKTDGAVIGHTESGEAQTNSRTRFMKADDGVGHEDWRASAVFDGDFRKGWLVQVGAKNTKDTRKAATSMMRKFFGREGWMEDITDLDALKTSVRKRWNDKYPDAGALTKGQAKGLGVRRPRRRKKTRAKKAAR